MGNVGMRAFGVELFGRWTSMWNGDLAVADDIMAPEFVLRYTQAGAEVFHSIRSPRQLAELVAAWRSSRTDLVFAVEGSAVVDLSEPGPSGLVARPYLATYATEDGATVARSGVDILGVSNGRIVEVWSVSSGSAGTTFYR